jgi:hypothetical protein
VDIGKLLAAALREFVFLAGAWLVAAYLLAFGLIVLLAGLKNIPHGEVGAAGL